MSPWSSVVQQLTIATIVCTTFAIASPLSRLSIAVATAESDQPCFESNPDIAGIGVRVSTYSQSFLLFFTTLLCIYGGHLDSRERKALEKSYTNLLITACALLISAYIEAVSGQLSIYHALLVLDWSWMLTLNALLLSVLPTIDGQIETTWSAWMKSALPSRTSQIPAMTFVSLYMSLMGAFGIYVWWHPDKLRGPTTGTSPDSVLCLQKTLTSIFFHQFRASSPTLRIVSIVCYFLVALPFINVFLLTAAAVLIVNMANALICKPYTFGRLYRITWIVQTAMNVVIAVNTELSITKNDNLIASGQSTWGFGQILAVVLISSPVLEALSVVKDKLRGSTRGRVSYQFQRLLVKSEDPWDTVFKNEYPHFTSPVRIIENLDCDLDPHARRAILGALTSAKEFFEAANTILEWSPVGTPDRNQEQHPPADGDKVDQFPKSVTATTAPVDTLPLANQPGQPAGPNTDTTTAVGTPHQHIPSGAPAQENQPGQTAAPPMADTTAPVREPREGDLPRSPTTAADRLKNVKRDIVNLWERMSKTCEVRFTVDSAESFLKAKAYLRASEEALGVAIIALEPLT